MAFIGNVQLVAGDSSNLADIFQMLEAEGIKVQGNPDVYVREYKSFGVEEARELSQRASSHALAQGRRIFIVMTPGMTAEAQNALLKTLEEPAGDAFFIIIVPAPHMLVATLRSRAQVLILNAQGSKGTIDPNVFLKAAPVKRMDMLKVLLEKDDDDKRNLGDALFFLADVERALAQDFTRNREGLNAIYRARKYIGDRGSLAKALLEQVALLV
jgi:DNA polymerase III delta prime subunit